MIRMVLDPDARARLEAANAKMREGVEGFRAELLRVFGDSAEDGRRFMACEALRCVATSCSQMLYGDTFPMTWEEMDRFFGRIARWREQALAVPITPDSDPRLVGLRDRLVERDTNG